MKYIFLIAAIAVTSCNSAKKSDTEPFTPERAVVNAIAVKEYVVNLNDPKDPKAEFRVALFEQKKSLDYEVRFSYKDASGNKIFTLPNLGFMPKPELKKGADSLTCVIGFYDADSTFKEFRAIQVENGVMSYKHLKEYQVEEPKK